MKTNNRIFATAKNYLEVEKIVKEYNLDCDFAGGFKSPDGRYGYKTESNQGITSFWWNK